MNITVVDKLDNSVVATTTVPKNSNITSWLSSLTVPTHEGYTFIGWNTTEGSITNVTADLTVYGYYQESGGGQVAIRIIDSINNSVVFSGYVNKNSDITDILNRTQIPTHEGYVFDRWETDGDDITNITKNTIVYIRYTQSSEAPEQPQTVRITVVDGTNASSVAVTTVPSGSDITSWLNSVEIPTHDGYVFDRWEISAGSITNVTQNAIVYIRYTESAEDSGRPLFCSYVNNVGNIIIEATEGRLGLTGSATVAIKMSKDFDSVEYDNFVLMDSKATGEETMTKTDVAISGDTITFTDENIATYEKYYIRLLLNDEGIGQTAWDAGFKPIKITITVDGTPHEYDIVSN